MPLLFFKRQMFLSSLDHKLPPFEITHTHIYFKDGNWEALMIPFFFFFLAKGSRLPCLAILWNSPSMGALIERRRNHLEAPALNYTCKTIFIMIKKSSRKIENHWPGGLYMWIMLINDCNNNNNNNNSQMQMSGWLSKHQWRAGLCAKLWIDLFIK